MFSWIFWHGWYSFVSLKKVFKCFVRTEFEFIKIVSSNVKPPYDELVFLFVMIYLLFWAYVSVARLRGEREHVVTKALGKHPTVVCPLTGHAFTQTLGSWMSESIQWGVRQGRRDRGNRWHRRHKCYRWNLRAESSSGRWLSRWTDTFFEENGCKSE